MAERNGNGQSPTGGGNILLGFGSPRPQPRVKTYGMFGHVPDAFDEKSIKIGDDHEKRLKAQREKELAKEASKEKEEEKEEKKENGTDEAKVEEEHVDVTDAAGPLQVSEAVGKKWHGNRWKAESFAVVCWQTLLLSAWTFIMMSIWPLTFWCAEGTFLTWVSEVLPLGIFCRPHTFETL